MGPPVRRWSIASQDRGRSHADEEWWYGHDETRERPGDGNVEERPAILGWRSHLDE
jgi:hypothetical protein